MAAFLFIAVVIASSAFIASVQADGPTFKELLAIKCSDPNTRKCIYHATCCIIGKEYCSSVSEACEQPFSDDMEPEAIKRECCEILPRNVTSSESGKREVCLDRLGSEMWRSVCTEQNVMYTTKEVIGIGAASALAVAVIAVFVICWMRCGTTSWCPRGEDYRGRTRVPQSEEELKSINIENQRMLGENKRNESGSASNCKRQNDAAGNTVTEANGPGNGNVEQHTAGSAPILANMRHHDESGRDQEATQNAPSEQGQGNQVSMPEEGRDPTAEAATVQNPAQPAGSAAHGRTQASPAGAGNREILLSGRGSSVHL